MKRQKNDAIDAEAICEAAQRPSMRFVAVKSEHQQAAGLVFRTRDLLVRQRTQLINAIRGHLTEYRWVAPKGPSHVTMLVDLLEEEEMAVILAAAISCKIASIALGTSAGHVTGGRLSATRRSRGTRQMRLRMIVAAFMSWQSEVPRWMVRSRFATLRPG